MRIKIAQKRFSMDNKLNAHKQIALIYIHATFYVMQKATRSVLHKYEILRRRTKWCEGDVHI